MGFIDLEWFSRAPKCLPSSKERVDHAIIIIPGNKNLIGLAIQSASTRSLIPSAEGNMSSTSRSAVVNDLEKAPHIHTADPAPASSKLHRTMTPSGRHPVDYSQTPIPISHRKYANPAPLGFLAFGTGFFITSLFNLHVRGITIPNVAVPMVVFFGGIQLIIAGIVELLTGNTFGCTIFSAYGGYNLAYGGIYLPDIGVMAAYKLKDGGLSPQYYQALGIFLIAWMSLSIVFLIGACRSSGAVVSTLASAALSFMMLGIHAFSGNDNCRLAGGWFGLISAGSAWWASMSGFWLKDSTLTWLKVNPIDFSPRD
ncbi:GPR1/FUN34/yaaH family-domain-containing protein [Cantharellus anzutake]|uniref:GPR1/FUN34/yaaH family-domain-containing protein n=1 Tax=Cantharellus anzutake TaxID=1750568 RepID=UPI0019071B2F|nr:GPR1/FUN34/yaaH family-domain-containing protein [Cantharellus anzutake]KAF8321971.1 GPR1/FUN34/yaaH family-domain-containing protein [Cantharellus anzutake]